MFGTSELKKMNLIMDDKNIGMISYNPLVNFKDNFKRPFIRNKEIFITKIGRVSYKMLDSIIITSLNDYYGKIINTKNEEEKAKKTYEYQELYALWQNVAKAKSVNDVNINLYYDDLVYRLYLLGYKK